MSTFSRDFSYDPAIQPRWFEGKLRWSRVELPGAVQQRNKEFKGYYLVAFLFKAPIAFELFLLVAFLKLLPQEKGVSLPRERALPHPTHSVLHYLLQLLLLQELRRESWMRSWMGFRMTISGLDFDP